MSHFIQINSHSSKNQPVRKSEILSFDYYMVNGKYIIKLISIRNIEIIWTFYNSIEAKDAIEKLGNNLDICEVNSIKYELEEDNVISKRK